MLYLELDLFTFLYRNRSGNPFLNPTEFRPRWKGLDNRPLPDLRHAIFFTPRSGSSYLSEVIVKTGTMGDAEEVFNPQMVHPIASAMGAKHLEQYVDKVMRARNMHGTFGAEITWPQLLMMFGGAARFLELVQPTKFLWLSRRDIVAQAVSIMAMVQSNVAHTRKATPAEIDGADSKIDYDKRYLKSTIKRLAWSERKIEDFFEAQQVTPLRLWYEDITKQSRAELVGDIARHLEIPGPEFEPKTESSHRKLPADKKAGFARRFRQENAGFVARVEAGRTRTMMRVEP